MKKEQKMFDSQSQAAASMGTTIERIAEAKRLGASGFRSGRIYPAALKRWCKANAFDLKPPKAPPVTAEAPAGAAPTGASGAPYALQRLAEAEVQLARKYDAALLSGDIARIRTAHRQWLQTCEALRRAEASLEENQRIAGDLLPRATAEKALTFFAEAFFFSLIASIDPVAGKILQQPNPALAGGILRESYFEIIETSLAFARQNFGDSDLPRWAEAALLAWWKRRQPTCETEIPDRLKALQMASAALVAIAADHEAAEFAAKQKREADEREALRSGEPSWKRKLPENSLSGITPVNSENQTQ